MGLVIIILVIFTANLFWPTTSVNDSGHSIQESIKIEPETSESIVQDNSRQESVVELHEPADDEKSERMAAEYKVLEKARKDLKRQLSRLKHEMWGLKFPVEEAKEINEIMLNAHKLIKNPNMLGAFYDVKGIQDEVDKIVFANKALEDVKAMIDENKQKNASSG